MPENQPNIKNPLSIGLLAHVDAGKTTLSEALLYVSGARRTLGRVDHRDAFLDTHDLERARGITIFSKQAILETDHREITLVDTPGHVDFSAEAERVLGILDCAVLVISGTDGVQAHTLTLWRLLERYQVPTFLFITKWIWQMPSGKRCWSSCNSSWIRGAWILDSPWSRWQRPPPCVTKEFWSTIWKPER